MSIRHEEIMPSIEHIADYCQKIARYSNKVWSDGSVTFEYQISSETDEGWISVNVTRFIRKDA